MILKLLILIFEIAVGGATLLPAICAHLWYPGKNWKFAAGLVGTLWLYDFTSDFFKALRGKGE